LGGKGEKTDLDDVPRLNLGGKGKNSSQSFHCYEMQMEKEKKLGGGEKEGRDANCIASSKSSCERKEADFNRKEEGRKTEKNRRLRVGSGKSSLLSRSTQRRRGGGGLKSKKKKGSLPRQKRRGGICCRRRGED